ncbi:hypothetical protein JAAARDRAFT_47935 [Jaapia argillacea MUCL 33604]|uniref:ABC transporter domain-containing protein n=1 Tax=Jaapia argillacea MUCL 33604 TaxID=933084 RepID=A0A067PP02_9AGAM|nr:hypothetical protein JAAARDRAFT_47935 [Jaapia argillacea MUCL 33604]
MGDSTPPEEAHEEDHTAIPSLSVDGNGDQNGLSDAEDEPESHDDSPGDVAEPVADNGKRRLFHGRRPFRGRKSHTKHVPINHFDPPGVQGLTRALSRLSTAGRTSTLRRTTSVFSDVTMDEGHFNLEKVLKNVIRKQEEHDIKGRELGVMFEDLRVVGLGALASYQTTFGSVLNPYNVLKYIHKARHPPLCDILNGFEGVVRPGEMLAVLGRPGAGCSTFLKVLANHRKEYRSVEGEVHYDAFSPADIHNHYRGDVQYCPEDDVHFPTLTVEETLNFAVKTRTPRSRFPGLSREDFAKVYTEVLLTIFGLKHARKTKVGNASVHGVSGGERKRVSIAETLATRALLTCWDNSTRGLDASTAQEFIQALRIATDLAHSTTIVSMYQAGESLYRMFDKVCVLYEGRMAYFGPANAARQYFIDLGYEPADRQTTADFLVAVTDPNGRIPRSNVDHPVPRTSAEFAAYFKNSLAGRLNREDIESYRAEFVGKPEVATAYMESARAERAKGMKKKSPYTISLAMQTRAVMVRRVQILKGNLGAQIITIATFLIQGIIMGTVFYKVPDSTSAYSRGGVLFLHHMAAMYHPFIEGLALTLVDIPITFITLAVFAVVLYFLVGLQRSASQFFVFYLSILHNLPNNVYLQVIFIMSQVLKSWFRLLAAAFSDPAPSQAFGGVVMLGLVLYTGYNIPKPYMIGALKWITYIDPLRYGYEAVLTNEFRTLNSPCQLIPQGPGYENITLANQVCPNVGAVAGQSRVNGATFVALSYGYHFSKTWMNLGITIAFAIGFFLIMLLLTELNTGSSVRSAVTQFKRGAKEAVARHRAAQAAATNGDEEKGLGEALPSPGVPNGQSHVEKALGDQPKMTDLFTWQHISYVVPLSGGEHRKLLDDVSGYVAPGKLTALMGESGAGKTTLLNALAERTDVGIVTGERYVNGQPLPVDFQAQTGYCQQLDVHLETATVREALLFSAKLRQPNSVPLSEKEEYVELCLKMCGLEEYADAVIGSLGVEHRKRTTIGVELAAKPRLLLFLDEPTSGLDSQGAWAIMTFLQSLARSGQAILCTIHQPSAELFHLFDRLLLLRKGGQTVFFGDLGQNSTNLIHYFESNGSRPIAPGENPAEFMLDVIGAGATSTSDIDWFDKWSHSAQAEKVQEEIEEIHSEGRTRPPVEAAFHTEFSTSWARQVYLLFVRDMQCHWRSPVYVFAKVFLNIISGLFVGFTFFHSKNTLQGTQNKLFAIFMGTIVNVAVAHQLQVPFIHMRDIYETRERPSRMYSWTALVTSQILVELPWNMGASTLWFFCWFWTVGFPSSRAGYTYLMMAVVSPMYHTTIGQAVAAMSANTEIAAILFSFLFAFVLTFNGVLQPFRLLGWWKWMYRVSPYTYLIEGLLGNALGHTETECSPVEYVKLTPPSGLTCGTYLGNFISRAGGYLTNPTANNGCLYCPYRSADDFLGSNFNIYYSHRWRDWALLFVFVAFNTCAIFTFTYLFRIRQWRDVGMRVQTRVRAKST